MTYIVSGGALNSTHSLILLLDMCPTYSSSNHMTTYSGIFVHKIFLVSAFIAVSCNHFNVHLVFVFHIIFHRCLYTVQHQATMHSNVQLVVDSLWNVAPVQIVVPQR